MKPQYKAYRCKLKLLNGVTSPSEFQGKVWIHLPARVAKNLESFLNKIKIKG